jgi:SAM-dependent methyltransferase
MRERYSNRKLYFDEQSATTNKYVIPYIEDVKQITQQSRVLEIGCSEAGNLKPFVDRQCTCVGVDINEYTIKLARDFYNGNNNAPKFFLKNIYDSTKDELGEFDIIILRDVIEHIFDQEKFMKFIKQFLKNDGVIFFGFPPWQMPYGGHQQVSAVKWIRKAPYIHLLPMKLYQYILRKSGESEAGIAQFTDIKKTGISIERFQKAVKRAGYKIDKKTAYFLNPNYEIKFGLRPRKKIPILGDIPYLKNFVTTCLYAIISRK